MNINLTFLFFVFLTVDFLNTFFYLVIYKNVYNHFCIVSVQNTGGVFVGNLLKIISPLVPFGNFVTLILCNKPICYFYQLYSVFNFAFYTLF